jgi:hypothetical protein
MDKSQNWRERTRFWQWIDLKRARVGSGVRDSDDWSIKV